MILFRTVADCCPWPWLLFVSVAAGWLLNPLAPGDDRAAATRPAEGAAVPLSAEAALEKFQFADGRLRLELVAAEPDVQDPVAAQFDETGRLWVVEMGDYPYGPPAGQPPRSRIKILEDRNGDGRFEQVTVFADQLLFATELLPWKGGVIVTLAGEVAYFRDTDGDGRADQRETWYRGFAQENSQLRANHPRLGLDGWIYVSNGLRGGSVTNVRQPDQPAVPLAGKDFRFHPQTTACEAVTGVGQFGLTFDDFGNRFICSNRNPLMHVVLEERFIQRNPQYAPPAARHDTGKAGEESRIYPISRAWTTSNLHAGQFTAACGVLIYRGGALPQEYYGGGFTCDPTGNLIHGEQIRSQGATFAGQPYQAGIEFLATTDEWFRPVNLFNGPDGALYVVDMYRAVIEHPDFMPEELKKRPDLLLGTDRGRIWRVVAKDAARTATPKWAAASSQELVQGLSESGWRGDTAFRLLYERQDSQVRPKLEELASTASGVGAIRALWLLHHGSALTDALLQSALKSTDPRVREQGVLLASDRSQADGPWRAAVASLAGDSDARVRFQVALNLAPIQNGAETAALREIAAAGSDDEWTRRAVAIAAGPFAGQLAISLLEKGASGKKPAAADTVNLLQDLFGIVAAQREHESLTTLLQAVCRAEQSAGSSSAGRGLLLSLAESVSRNGIRLSELAAKLPEEDRRRLHGIFERARADLRSGEGIRERMTAAQLLGYDEQAVEELASLVKFSATDEATPTELRARILAALSRQPKFEGWKELLADWPRESPTYRRALLEALLSRTERTMLLLAAIEAGTVKPSELETAVSNRLLKHGQAEIRKKAELLLASLIPADRQKVLAEYQPVLQWKADSLRGRQVFAKNCAACHRIGDLGVNVAPDISDSRVKKPEQLLTDILQPNRAIDNNYLSYTVVTTDGITLTGVIASETGTSLTIRQQEGKETTLLRTNIEDLRSNGVSLMPEGLEKTIPPQDMADLIAFIKNWRYLDGRTPLAREADAR